MENQGDTDNKRTFTRLRADINVKFDAFKLDQGAADKIVGVINNISLGGIFIKTRRPLPVNTFLKVEFEIPEKNQIVKAVGVVRWSGNTQTCRGMGIRFVKVTTSDKKVIKEYVEKKAESVYEFDPTGETAKIAKMYVDTEKKRIEKVKENPEELFKRLPFNEMIQRVASFYVGEIDNFFTLEKISDKCHVDPLWLQSVLFVFEDAGLMVKSDEKIRFVNPKKDSTWKKLLNWAVEFLSVGEDTSGRYSEYFE